MKPEEAILMMRNRIDTASEIAGKGTDGKAFEDMEMAIKALEEIQQYRKIGTVEECREAVEKQKPKKPVKDKYNHNCCPNCGWIVSGEGGYGEEFCPHCENCGQAIRWENLGEMEDERD